MIPNARITLVPNLPRVHIARANLHIGRPRFRQIKQIVLPSINHIRDGAMQHRPRLAKKPETRRRIHPELTQRRAPDVILGYLQHRFTGRLGCQHSVTLRRVIGLA